MNHKENFVRSLKYRLYLLSVAEWHEDKCYHEQTSFRGMGGPINFLLACLLLRSQLFPHCKFEKFLCHLVLLKEIFKTIKINPEKRAFSRNFWKCYCLQVRSWLGHTIYDQTNTSNWKIFWFGTKLQKNFFAPALGRGN